MKYGRLIAFAGAVIVASPSPLLAGASAASAAAVPATTVTVGDCVLNLSVTVYEERDSNGSYVRAYVSCDPLGIGVEGAIEGPGGTPQSFGGDVHSAGQDSVTGHIPINSRNHHGYRYWFNNKWNYNWVD